MPRPKRPGAPEPKKRSRNGCCCQRTGEACDYSIRLNWEGRKKKNPGFETILFQTPSESSSSSPQHEGRSSDTKSGLSPATTARLTERQTPATSAFNVNEQADIPPSGSGSVCSASPSTHSPFPGLSLFVSQFAGQARGDSDEVPLCSPDLTSSPQQPPQIASPSESTSAGATPRFFSSTASSALVPATSVASPLTPAASSPYSDGGSSRQPPSSQGALASPDLRRLSVNSLLSGPPGPVARQYAPPSERAINARTTLCLSEDTLYYGIDPGFKDLDLGKNDDIHAIIKAFKGSSIEEDLRVADAVRFNMEKDFTGPKGYYDRPVPIKIPRDLEPLPAKLRENPMNLLYFHHFMNHTAKALVPHDDQQSNPYRHVLPQMAVKNDNLLSLMLAYSASHRAHLLNQPEPATRIALWVQDIFPALRRALNDPNQSISNANIATGIMLASLEIVSPTAFGYQIPWQRHLGLARELIASRPDGLRWTRCWTQEDQVRAFLWSWLAYLDVLGTLSGGRGESSTAWILDYQKDDYEEEFDEIDCIMGMTTRCVYILAKIAELAKQCDSLRVSGTTAVDVVPAMGREWRPPNDIITRAWALEDEAKRSMALPPQPCKHLHASGDVARWDQVEMAALNESFHWAGLVHLHRRVLGKPSGHEDVQAAVLKIHSCIDCMPMGGKVEASLLFPLFTAACETADEKRRDLVRERLDSMARSGFLEVNKAKALIEKVWETERPWEDLLTTEFIG
ncbi:Acriflavine sensitivity control protein acr-2 [Cytospora mali]|uniref:Acriflavine sensitivity control protein acr-2 n=1 Tax=Cytospora mali TaxID=578113 RepID=A0A194VU10_CYTMA|nr:Acriflavine sensitivity control protein acr-2 [Valsa mali]